ncbi:MAG: hypothetical protein ACK595_20325, partial [Planctomycetota bacterium]
LRTDGADDRLASAEVVIVDAEKHGIRFATQPLLTVQLRPRTALFELEVPIVVDDRALPEALRGRWQPEVQSRIVRVRVDVGPGSYTGLRVALTFVRCLQRFGGVAVEAVDSLALLAARAAAPGVAARRVHAVLDARRERVHAQAFAVGAAVRALAPAAAVSVAVAAAAVGPGELVVVPACLPPALRAAFADRGAEVLAVAGVVAAERLAPGVPFAAAGFADLEPRYLMGSYAED